MKRLIFLLNKVSSVILRRKPKDPITGYGFFALLRMTKRNRKSMFLIALGILFGLGLVSFFLLQGKSAAAAWWNDGWNYRKTVQISNSTSDLTDYQSLITLDTATLVSAGKLQSDCDDIRVVGQNGEQYNYWIEPNSCNTSTTKIWVKIPLISSTGTDIYVYYGNVSASSISKAATDIFMQEVSNVSAGWMLDESTANGCTGGEDSCDSSGGDYDLTWGTGTSNTIGKIGNGLNFDGTDNATANIDDAFAPITSTKRWTVALWFKTSDTDGYLFDTGDAANIGDRVAVFTDGANNLSLYMSSNTTGTEYKYLNYSVTSTDNNWHQLVVTRDGDNSVKLYVDATPISVSFTTTDVDMTSYSETWTDFHLGHRYFLNIYNYTGVIDEARVYSVSLTTDEISALYGDGSNRHGYVTANYPGKELVRKYSSNVSVGSPGSEQVGPGPIAYWKFDEGSGTSVNDSSGNNHTGTLGTGSSAPNWQSEDSCVSGKCLLFDGVNDHVSGSSSFTNLDEVTVQAWIKLNQLPPNASRTSILRLYTGGSNALSFNIANDSTNQGRIQLVRFNSWGIDGRAWEPQTSAGNSRVTVGKWYHVSVVQSGNSASFYVNGVRTDEFANAQTIWGSGNYPTSASQFQIGFHDSPYLNGFIDDIKIYPYARSEDEIKQDYLFSSTQGSSVVLGASDTSFLSNGLVGYWKMDETTGTTGPSWTAVDSSGNTNSGTGAGNAVVSTGKFGNGGEFDGNGDYLDMGDQVEHDLTFPFTLSSWINLSQLPSDKGSDAEIMSKYGGSGTRQWTLSIGTDNVLYFFKSHNGTNGEYGVVTGHEFTSADVGVWRLVTYSVDSQGNAKMYIDGELVESYTFSNLTIYTGASSTMRIGARALNSNYFKGSIDEARIYNRSLSPGEVKSLSQWAPGPIVYYDLNENSGTSSVSDKSGNGNTGSMSGFAGTDWKTGKYGSSLNFDETNNYLEVANNSSIQDLSSGDFTTSFWLKTVQAGGYSTGIIATKFACFPAGNGWNIYLNRQGMSVGIVNEFGTTDASYVSASDSIPSDEWAYVTVVWRGEGRTADIYVDGVEVSYTTQTAGVGTLGSDASLPLRVGRHNGCANFLNGQLDEFRIYNYARTQSQIIEDMNAGHPAVGTPVGSTVLHLRMDEGYGTTANDSSPQGNDGTIATALWSQNGRSGKAIAFNGSSGYINAGSDSSLDELQTMTVSAWIYPTGYGEGNFGRIINKSDTSSTNWGLTLVNDSGQQSIRFFKERNAASNSTQATAASGSIQLNRWYHVLGIYDENATPRMRLFIDGKEVTYAEQIEGTGSPDADASYDLTIGNRLIGDRTFSGTIDEVKIYPFALTVNQVAQDYRGGKMLVLGATNTDVGGTSPSNSASREYCVPGDTASCGGPVIELNFEENNGITANDTSTNANTGTLTNGPSWKPSSQCKSGSCIQFDGTDDYVNIKTSTGLSSFNNPQTAFTLEGWIKTTNTGTTRYIYSNTTEDGWHNIAVNSVGQASMGIRNSSWGGSGINSTSIINDGQWHHVAGVFNNPTMSIYVDGVLENTGTFSGSLLSSGGWGGGGVRAGVYYLPDGGYFNGHIDGVRIYNYARTPAQIAWDMNKGAPLIQYRFDECQGTTVHDVTGNGYNATMSIGGNDITSPGTCNTSGTSWGNGATGKWNASLDLDGSDDYLSTGSTIPALAGVSEMSVCSWIKYEPASVTADGVIVGQYSGSPPGWLLWVDDVGAVFGETDTVSFSPNPVGGSAGRVEGTTGLVSTGVWDHYCGVFKGGSFIRLYKNGVLNAENTSSIVSAADVPDTVLQIGRWTNFNNSYFDGQVDDIRIYNYALTSHQVKEVYGGGAVVFK